MGITGDDRPYAGTPVNADYIITPEQWKNYTKTMAMVYCDAFASINRPVLFNLDNPGKLLWEHTKHLLGFLFSFFFPPFPFVFSPIIYSRLTPRTKGYNDTDDPWIVEQCPGSLVKQGIVSHGYQLNTELDLYQQWQNEGFQNVFSRGELALEPNPAEGEEAALLTAPAAVRLHPTALRLHSYLPPPRPPRKNNWYAVLDAGAGAGADMHAHFTTLLRQVRLVDPLAILVAASQRGVGLDVWSWCVELVLWIFRQQLILACVRIFQPARTIPTKRGCHSCGSVCVVPGFAGYR